MIRCVGVIPGRGYSHQSDQHRVTLMVAFWKELECRSCDNGRPGPSQAFPKGGPMQWPRLFKADALGWGDSTPPVAVNPFPLNSVWEKINHKCLLEDSNEPRYDTCFQGF